MNNINLIGNIFGSTGYAMHTKGLFNALYKINPNICLDSPKQLGWERLVNDAELNALTKSYYKDGIAVCVMSPPNWRFSLADNHKKFYGFCVWEGDKIPTYWLEYLFDERVDGILVPSKHVEKAIFKTIRKKPKYLNSIIDKIHVVPHGVDTNLFKPSKKKGKKPYVFLACKGWSHGKNDRGGIQYILRAFCEEFDKGEDVELMLKINPAYNNPGWSFEQELSKLKLKEAHPPIKVNSEQIEYKALPGFYHQGDVFVCATRAEAFNIPGLEAKACGLPSIQTGFGGQTDYMTENDTKIDYVLEEVEHDVMYEGIMWATPHIKSIKKVMRKCFKESHSPDKEVIANEAKAWTWDESAKKLLEVLK